MVPCSLIGSIDVVKATADPSAPFVSRSSLRMTIILGTIQNLMGKDRLRSTAALCRSASGRVCGGFEQRSGAGFEEQFGG